MDRYKWPNVITTTAIKLPNTTPNSTKITYNHNVVFKNVTFAKVMAARFMKHFLWRLCNICHYFTFLFDQTLDKCSSSNQVYNFTSSEAMQLNIDQV
jgi:hypothetical protein